MTNLRRAALAAVAVLLLAYLVANCLHYVPYTVDDAFISFRYARNLALGQGLTYNLGEPVEGYSNLSHVLVSAMFLRLGWPLLTSVKLFGLICALLTAGATAALVRRLLDGHPQRDLGAILALALVCLHTSFAVWAEAGLETVLYALILVLAVWQFERDLERSPRIPGSALLAFALALTRPETPIYLAYFVGRLAWRARRPEGRPMLRRWLLVFAPLFVAYEAWGLWTFGQLFPNTHAAKVGSLLGRGTGPALPSTGTPGYLESFFTRQGWGFLAVLAFGGLGAVFPERRRLLAPMLVALGGIAFAAYAGADWMPRHRLLVPILPMLLAGAAIGFSLAWGAARRLRFGAPFAFGLLLLAGLASIVDYAREQAFGAPVGPEKNRGNYARLERGPWWLDVADRVGERIYPLEGLAADIVRFVPEGEFVVMHDIGFAGFLSDNPIWDVAGLVTPTAARARHGNDPAAEEVAYEDMLSRNPALIILRLRAPGSLARRLHARLSADPRVAENYALDTPSNRRARADRRWGRTWPEDSPMRIEVWIRRDLVPEVDAARLERAASRLEGEPLTPLLHAALHPDEAPPAADVPPGRNAARPQLPK